MSHGSAFPRMGTEGFLKNEGIAPMSSIDSVQQIVATIRSEMATRVARGEVRPAPKRPARTHDGAARQSRMNALISQRVAALDPADPQRGRKAFRIFLESVLLGEFGENLMNDQAFYTMVDEVQTMMEQDPEMADAMQRAAAALLDKLPDAA